MKKEIEIGKIEGRKEITKKLYEEGIRDKK